MPAITENAIRQLAGFRAEQAEVVSCYLDVDGRRYLRHQDYERELQVLLRRAQENANGSRSVATDLHRIEDFVKAGVDRSSTRGLAMFACGAHGLWEAFTLPVPVRSHVSVGPSPAVGQLEAILQDSERLGVLLCDKQRARMFVFELGELVDHSELFEELPRDYDERGEQDRGDTQHHVAALTSQHVRHAARVAFDVFQGSGFERLTIGAPDEICHLLEAELHPYLKERLAGRITVSASAPMGDIRGAARQVEVRVERETEARAVDRLREAVHGNGKGAAGLDKVLTALNERRVDRLLVSQGFSDPGWRCQQCGALARVGPTCPVCGSDLARVDDVVEEAIEEALAQSCRIEICIDNADLDVLGRVGALLRY